MTGIETLLSGGTCIMDHVSLIPDREVEGLQQVVKAYQDVRNTTYDAPDIYFN